MISRYVRAAGRFGARAQPFHRMSPALQPYLCREQIVPREFQLAAIMRLKAHHAIGEGVETAIDQPLQRERVAGRLAHLPGPIDQEVVVHPEGRAGIPALAIGLVLRDFVGMVDLAMIDPAGVDI